MFTIRTLSAIREFFKNSTRSGECIDSKWLRALLALHLMVTAICIMIFFPSIFRADVSVEYGAHILQWLILIAICGLSARLARGEVVARLPFWIVHGLWVLSVLVGMIWYWGAFDTLGPEDVALFFRPDEALMSRPGYITAGFDFALLSVLCSGIPIFVRIWMPQVGKLFQETGAWGFRRVSLVSLVAFVGVAVVFPWMPFPLNVVSIVSPVALLIGWLAAAVGITRGERTCLLILVAVSFLVGGADSLIHLLSF